MKPSLQRCAASIVCTLSIALFGACVGAHDVERRDSQAGRLAAGIRTRETLGIWSWEARAADGAGIVLGRSADESLVVRLRLRVLDTDEAPYLQVVGELPQSAAVRLRPDGSPDAASSTQLAAIVAALRADVKDHAELVAFHAESGRVGVLTAALKPIDPDGAKGTSSVSQCMLDCTEACPQHDADECHCGARCGGTPVGLPAQPATGSTANGGIPIYGNYCGPAHGDDTGALPAIDAVDAACQTHDACYLQRGYFNCSCDRELLASVPAAAIIAGTPGAAAAASAIAGFFAGFPCQCWSWACVILPNLCIGIGGYGSIC